VGPVGPTKAALATVAFLRAPADTSYTINWSLLATWPDVSSVSAVTAVVATRAATCACPAALNLLSIVSKLALIFVPHVSVDAPTSGLVKFRFVVVVSAIVGSC
jgi:hypothetical protein